MNDTATRLITLTCPSCGAKLKLIDGVHLLACASCGNEHMVHRADGSIYLAPIAQDVRQIRVGTDKTAAELAIPRLKQEIKAIEAQAEITRGRNYIDQTPESSNTTLLQVGLAVSIIAALVFFALGNLLIALMCAVAFLCSIAWHGSLSDKRTKAAEILRETDLNRIQAQHVEKSMALAKNQKIANS